MKRQLTYLARIPYCKNKCAQTLLQLMENKKTNLCLAADLSDSNQLLELIDKVGSEICVVKTHVDIIENFSFEFIQRLKELSKRHQFLIFEDRKFADIGNTVKQQYYNGIYRIAEWADIINGHSLPGPGMIQGLQEVSRPKKHGMLLIAEMSSNQHLFSKEYIQKTIALAETFSDFVFGFITPRKISTKPHWIYFTPGIQFEVKKDTLSQQYMSPARALMENESDIIIVGRGIVEAKDPLASARRYRLAGWEAYQASLDPEEERI